MLATFLLHIGVVFFDHPNFDESWDNRWYHHAWHEHSERFGHNGTHRALQTTVDARFYHASASFDRVYAGTTFVIQYRVWHPQNIDCGGGYVKLLDSTTHEIHERNGSTPYRLMFGPDVCGAKNRTHIIISHNDTYFERTVPLPCRKDALPHVYSLHVDAKTGLYEVYIDAVHVTSGELRDDWRILPPRVIPDERFTKPDDWVDETHVEDPNDSKPSDWDDEPTIVDADAVKPMDWDDEDDGEWEAPQVTNPSYNGTWKARRVPNPLYRGEWRAPTVTNPDFFDDDSIGRFDGVDTLAVEIWQVKSGSLFDEFLVTDEPELAHTRARALANAGVKDEV